MTDLATTWQEKKERIRALRQQAQVEARAVFDQGAADLFAKYGALVFFRWQQYTPYFNDGDECVFQPGTDYISVTVKLTRWDGEDMVEEEHEFEEVSSWDFKPDSEVSKEYPVFVPLLKDVHGFLATFDADDLKPMFGDHAEITVTKDGTQVSLYDHD